MKLNYRVDTEIYGANKLLCSKSIFRSNNKTKCYDPSIFHWLIHIYGEVG